MTLMTERYGYTANEKALIRRGLMCPGCFGVNTEPRMLEMMRKPAVAFQCRDCKTQWHAHEVRFQSAGAER